MLGLRFGAGPLRLLCLGAHPDDIEIGCGGSLLELSRRRDIRVDFAILTGTDLRQAEALTAQALFLPEAAKTMHQAGLADGRLPQVWGEAKDFLMNVAATVPKPDLIFAPRSDDAHQDHRIVAEMATTVWRDSLTLHYEIPKWDGDLGTVTHYLPVSVDNAAEKVRLLDRAFPSQAGREWWDEETFRSLMRLRGVECKERYAEGFSVRKAVLTF
jgi:LmbE family N-acetylglucosaminyl deacetylase